jgi:hypothetical protein
MSYEFRANPSQIYGVLGTCKCNRPLIGTEDGATVCDGCFDFQSKCSCDKYVEENFRNELSNDRKIC